MILKLRTQHMLEDMTQEGLTGKEAIAQAVVYTHAARMLIQRVYMNVSREMGEKASDSVRHTVNTAGDFVTITEAACLGMEVPLMCAASGEELAALDAFVRELEEQFDGMGAIGEKFDG